MPQHPRPDNGVLPSAANRRHKRRRSDVTHVEFSGDERAGVIAAAGGVGHDDFCVRQIQSAFGTREINRRVLDPFWWIGPMNLHS